MKAGQREQIKETVEKVIVSWEKLTKQTEMTEGEQRKRMLLNSHRRKVENFLKVDIFVLSH